MDALGRKTCGTMRTVKPCGPGSPMLEIKFAELFRERWWLKSPAHQEEHGAAVKPLRRECRSDFGVPVLACVRLFRFAREAVGAACTRHSLRPLLSEGHRIAKPGREIAPRECFFTASSLRGVQRRSNPDCLRGGILDCFASLAMTALIPRNPHSRHSFDERAPFRSLQGACRERIAIDRRHRRHQCAVCDRAGWQIRPAQACRGRSVSLAAGCAVRLSAGAAGERALASRGRAGYRRPRARRPHLHDQQGVVVLRRAN